MQPLPLHLNLLSALPFSSKRKKEKKKKIKNKKIIAQIKFKSNITVNMTLKIN